MIRRTNSGRPHSEVPVHRPAVRLLDTIADSLGVSGRPHSEVPSRPAVRLLDTIADSLGALEGRTVKFRFTDQQFAYLILLPIVLFFTILTLYPISYSLYTSLLVRGTAGIGNYIQLFRDAKVLSSISLSVEFSVLATVMCVFLSLGIALILNRESARQTILKSHCDSALGGLGIRHGHDLELASVTKPRHFQWDSLFAWADQLICELGDREHCDGLGCDCLFVAFRASGSVFSACRAPDSSRRSIQECKDGWGRCRHSFSACHVTSYNTLACGCNAPNCNVHNHGI